MRRSTALLLLIWVSCTGAPTPVMKSESDANRHDYDIRHYSFHLELDETPRRVSGWADISITANGTCSVVNLDAADMVIESVQDETGCALRFRHAPPRLEINFAKPFRESTIKIRWMGNPKRGLFWSSKPFQIWSKSQPEYTHYWLPCHDYPNDRATLEMRVCVPARYTAISNGALVGKTISDGKAVFHWSQRQPIVSYLISIVVGEFDEYRDGQRVAYFVPRGSFTEEEVRWSLGRTPEMIRFFEEKFGIPYPYDKYYQIVAWGYHTGGMEHASATTLEHWAIIPNANWENRTSQGLVAHELAHQWIGNLVTCRSWDHLWLNEGLASYCESLWWEHSRGRDDRAKDLSDLRSWLLEDQSASDRSVVPSSFSDPEELFDGITYAKGAWVIHMLRIWLGEERFWEGLRSYLRRNQEGLVATADFQRSMEDAAGESLGWFFDQWLRRKGLPKFKAAHQWDAKHQTLRVTIRQEPPVFRVPADVEIQCQGRSSIHSVWITAAEHVYEFPCKAEPDYVAFDPEGNILKTLEHPKSMQEFLCQLREAPHAILRVRAAQELAAASTYPQAVAALKAALFQDAHPWVRETAARSLSSMGRPDCRDVLLEACTSKDAKLREAALTGLGKWAQDEPVLAALKKAAEADPSWICRRNALKSLGKAGRTALPYLLEKLNSNTNPWIVAGVIQGLTATQDPDVLPILVKCAGPEHESSNRRIAIEALAELGTGRADVADFLISTLDLDPDYWVIDSTIGALEELGDKRAIEALEQASRNACDGRLERIARRAAQSLKQADD